MDVAHAFFTACHGRVVASLVAIITCNSTCLRRMGSWMLYTFVSCPDTHCAIVRSSYTGLFLPFIPLHPSFGHLNWGGGGGGGVGLGGCSDHLNFTVSSRFLDGRPLTLNYFRSAFLFLKCQQLIHTVRYCIVLP